MPAGTLMKIVLKKQKVEWCPKSAEKSETTVMEREKEKENERTMESKIERPNKLTTAGHFFGFAAEGTRFLC